MDSGLHVTSRNWLILRARRSASIAPCAAGAAMFLARGQRGWLRHRGRLVWEFRKCIVRYWIPPPSRGLKAAGMTTPNVIPAKAGIHESRGGGGASMQAGVHVAFIELGCGQRAVCCACVSSWGCAKERHACLHVSERASESIRAGAPGVPPGAQATRGAGHEPRDQLVLLPQGVNKLQEGIRLHGCPSSRARRCRACIEEARA